MPRRAVFLSLLLGTMLAFAAVAAPPQPPVKPAPAASQTPSVVINNLPPLPASHSIATPQLDKPAWTYLAAPITQGILAFGAFVFTWLQFQKTHKQREEHLDKTQKQAAELAQRKEEADSRLAEIRQEQERLHFERRELQEQFVDIENRLASAEPIIRANAALRLAEFAKRPQPRPTEAPVEQPRTEEHFPYFVPVASQLATALHLESNAAVRQDILKAFRSLAEWACNETDQPLLQPLIERMADANRTAKNAFIKAMAEYNAVLSAAAETKNPSDNTKMDFEFLTALAPFCEHAETSEICLSALMTEGEERDEGAQVIKRGKYAVQQAVYAAKRKAQTEEERTKEDASRLPRLETAAQQLIDTRNAMAQALKLLAQPADFPQQAISDALSELSVAVTLLRTSTGEPQVRKSALKQIKSSAKTIQTTLQQWNAICLPSLSQCFLAGADLREAQLQGADLWVAQLQGANLWVAQLQGADLVMAQLQGADLSVAQLQGAYLPQAQLQGAYLSEADLQGAYLSQARLKDADLLHAQLQGADLSGALLKGANLSWAQLQGANLIMALLQGADLSEALLKETFLLGIFVQETKDAVYQQTNFSAANWQQANWEIPTYADGEIRTRTERVREWLAREFPSLTPDDNETPPAEEGKDSISTDGAGASEPTGLRP